jgi:hypothetical protein
MTSSLQRRHAGRDCSDFEGNFRVTNRVLPGLVRVRVGDLCQFVVLQTGILKIMPRSWTRRLHNGADHAIDYILRNLLKQALEQKEQETAMAVAL